MSDLEDGLRVVALLAQHELLDEAVQHVLEEEEGNEEEEEGYEEEEEGNEEE